MLYLNYGMIGWPVPKLVDAEPIYKKIHHFPRRVINTLIVMVPSHAMNDDFKALGVSLIAMVGIALFYTIFAL